MLAISTEPGVLSPALVVQRPLMNLRRSTLRTNTPHFDGGPGGPLIAWYIHTVRPQVPTVATARNGITKAVTMRNAYISIRRLCDALSIFCGALDMMSRSRPLDLGQCYAFSLPQARRRYRQFIQSGKVGPCLIQIKQRYRCRILGNKR